ncbi:hypothetical protein G7Z17_g11950 [Cylindrodendrum hubeiense]|uniref:Uncharacterized protein n=1 Tax=Cylindrodendrum hubeiense TaxID=595255 RepID=A0A9P5GYK4_9HYPO|nr:hypothetical protein G7Z17_g11950 [Cylindrodendrum hubeiense]
MEKPTNQLDGRWVAPALAPRGWMDHVVGVGDGAGAGAGGGAVSTWVQGRAGLGWAGKGKAEAREGRRDGIVDGTESTDKGGGQAMAGHDRPRQATTGHDGPLTMSYARDNARRCAKHHQFASDRIAAAPEFPIKDRRQPAMPTPALPPAAPPSPPPPPSAVQPPASAATTGKLLERSCVSLWGLQGWDKAT